MVHVLEPHGPGRIVRCHRTEARHEETLVAAAFHQGVDGVAVGADGGGHDLALVVAQHPGLMDRRGAPLDGPGERLARVVHPERQIPDPVAVAIDVVGHGPRLVGQVRTDRGGEQEADPVLLEQVAGAVADAGLGAAVSHELESEGGAVVVAGLPGVSDPEFDVVGAVDREGVGDGCGRGEGLGRHALLQGGSVTQRKDSQRLRLSPPHRAAFALGIGRCYVASSCSGRA